MTTGVIQYMREAKVGLLAHYCSFVVLAVPDAVLSVYERLAGLQPGTQIPLVVRRRDGSVYPTPSMEQVLREARELKGFGFGGDLFTFVMRAISVKLGDQLKDDGFLRQDVPLLQFMRHLRNAAAHNNRWHFTGGEPRFPAQFRQFTLDPSMHGQQVFLDYLTVGDFLDLLDDLTEYLENPR